MPIEYLDPEITSEGQSANNWVPGDWTNSSNPADEEYQPELEPPHVNDYAALKKHKHYKQYFRPYRYQAFPAILYHPTQGEKIVKSKEEVAALGPEWQTRPIASKIDMTGKSHPVKSDTQRLTEALVAGLTEKQGTTPVDPTTIAAIVAAVMAAQAQQPVKAVHSAPELQDESGEAAPSHDVERAALIELAEKNNIKIDKRWSNERLKEVLNLS